MKCLSMRGTFRHWPCGNQARLVSRLTLSSRVSCLTSKNDLPPRRHLGGGTVGRAVLGESMTIPEKGQPDGNKLRHNQNAVLGETMICRNHRNILCQRCRDYESVCRITVDLRKFRGPEHHLFRHWRKIDTVLCHKTGKKPPRWHRQDDPSVMPLERNLPFSNRADTQILRLSHGVKGVSGKTSQFSIGKP